SAPNGRAAIQFRVVLRGDRTRIAFSSLTVNYRSTSAPGCISRLWFYPLESIHLWNAGHKAIWLMPVRGEAAARGARTQGRRECSTLRQNDHALGENARSFGGPELGRSPAAAGAGRLQRTGDCAPHIRAHGATRAPAQPAGYHPAFGRCSLGLARRSGQ